MRLASPAAEWAVQGGDALCGDELTRSVIVPLAQLPAWIESQHPSLPAPVEQVLGEAIVPPALVDEPRDAQTPRRLVGLSASPLRGEP